MNRRDFVVTLAVAAPARVHSQPAMIDSESRAELLSQPLAAAANQPAQRTAMGVNLYSFAYRRPKSALEFLEYCRSLGAGGVQTELDSTEPDYLRTLRQRAEELGMFLEVITALPGDKPAEYAKFEQTVKAAQKAGALCLRTACLSGRRYETFTTLGDWKKFVADSKARIARAVPLMDRCGIPLGIENHKDWTADEQVELLKQYSSEYLGACVDTGNNIALLDDPYELVERLAPYAVSTHIKDMAVDEYPAGILIAEVPLGAGMLDMRRIVKTIARARPRTRFTLEMITRDPLRVPCLSRRYWATFPERNGWYLAQTLSMVREHKPRRPLPQPEELDRGGRLRLEEKNVELSLGYAGNELGLH